MWGEDEDVHMDDDCEFDERQRRDETDVLLGDAVGSAERRSGGNGEAGQ